jgi:hypothetical protein
MATQVTLLYTIEPTGASSAAVGALMQSVPVPAVLLQSAGLRVTSDVTALGPPVTRTIVLAFGPTVDPTATATLNNAAQVEEVVTTLPGIDLILPPQVSFVGGGDNIVRRALARAFLNMQDIALVSGGTLYSAETVAVVLGAMPSPTYITKYPPGYGRQEALSEIDSTGTFLPSCVQSLSIAVQGKGYSSSARIQFEGGLDPANPNARPAQAVITTLGPKGEIFAVQLIDPGQGYIKVPQIVVVDPAQASGGFMPMRPDPITGRVLNPNTTGAQYGDARPSAINNVLANISPVMGQGTPAKIALTVGGGGIITGAHVTQVGDGYIGLPQIFLFDPTGAGSGGQITPRMGVGTIQLVTGGQGYEVAPAVDLTFAFDSLFPVTGDQRAPFWNLMQPAIQTATMSPVSSAAPVLA